MPAADAPIRVALVNDDDIIVEGLRAMLEAGRFGVAPPPGRL